MGVCLVPLLLLCKISSWQWVSWKMLQSVQSSFVCLSSVLSYPSLAPLWWWWGPGSGNQNIIANHFFLFLTQAFDVTILSCLSNLWDCSKSTPFVIAPMPIVAAEALTDKIIFPSTTCLFIHTKSSYWCLCILSLLRPIMLWYSYSFQSVKVKQGILYFFSLAVVQPPV